MQGRRGLQGFESQRDNTDIWSNPPKIFKQPSQADSHQQHHSVGGDSGSNPTEMQKMKKYYEDEIMKIKMNHKQEMDNMQISMDHIKAQNVVDQDQIAQLQNQTIKLK